MGKRKFLIVFALLAPILVLFLAFSPLQENVHPILQNILKKFEGYIARLPEQKVYLHLDKSKYNADETLWFKAYLLNAADHKPDSSTTNLYVELISPSGFIAQSKLIRMTNGFGNGDFSFLDTIPEGVYKIRAFTNWMRNFNGDFFFEKEVYIANPAFSAYVSREDLRTIKKENRKNQKKELKIDIQFLPEGGHMLAGVENRIGFKALNELGHGFPVKGRIVDSKENTIVEFESSQLGMGSFILTPALNEKYTALVNVAGDKPEIITIPEALPRGVAISAQRSAKGIISIKVLNNFPSRQLPANNNYFLLAHSRGRIIFTHEFILNEPVNSFEITESQLPSGIIHLTLFNAYSLPVSERLLFINNGDALNVSMELFGNTLSSREKNSVKIKISDKNNNPISGHFSFSIANSEDIDKSDNIVSYLLLNSDLKGTIENPQYYFSSTSSENKNNLDNLMLTQGWRRFSWTGVLSDVKIPAKYENEKGILISGRVTKEFFNRPLRDIKVTLSILNEFNDVFTARSGEKGIYRFESLDYADTVSVSIEAVRASGKHNLILYVDAMPDDRDKGMQYKTNQKLTQKGEKSDREPASDPADVDPYAERNNAISRLHDEPSPANVIIVDESNRSYQSIGQIIEGRVPGVMVTGNNVNIRGSRSMGTNTDPLFLVDGMPVDAEYAMGMNPYDVERIEILKGAETAIYGSRGANGVIAIYTKRGKFMKKGILEFKMLGYATPKEYYKPSFEYRKDDVFVDDRRTILWQPSVKTDLKGEAMVTFYTSDTKGNFTLCIEGISNEGIPGMAETRIEVK